MGRVAIVTGGTRGIGRAVSIALKTPAARSLPITRATMPRRKAFRETGIHAKKWDVADFDACLTAASMVGSEFGPVEILVNNAGITRDATMRKMSRANWDQVLDVNLGGCFNMCRAVWESMLGKNFGRIVNIGSVNGQAGQYGQVNYAASKSGIHGFTKALAQEGATKGITVERHRTGLYRHRNGRRRARQRAGEDRRPHSSRTARPCRGNRPGRGVPGVRRGRLRHRLDPLHQWRPAYVLSEELPRAAPWLYLSWPATAGHPGDEGFNRREDVNGRYFPCRSSSADLRTRGAAHFPQHQLRRCPVARY